MPASYVLDITGTLLANKIVDEPHTLTEINSTTYDILVPDFAPFYLDNLALKHVADNGTVTPLSQGIHYNVCLPYAAATRSIGKPIYGGLSINDKPLNGHIQVTYQTLGGDWTADKAFVLTRLYESIHNPRTAYWDTITNIQDLFPPINHNQNFDYVFGHQELIDAVNDLIAAVQARPMTAVPLSHTHPLADILDINSKQNLLISGTNIKTLNGQSMLGAGDIIISTIDVEGPTQLYRQEIAYYKITNYNSLNTYNVSAIAGSVTRQEDIIAYSAPSLAGIPGDGFGGFIINGKQFKIKINTSGIQKPVIARPIINISSSEDRIAFIGSQFTDVGSTLTMAGAVWQIALDSSFDKIIHEETVVSPSGQEIVNYTPVLASIDWTNYRLLYARVKYYDDSAEAIFSNWSEPAVIIVDNVEEPNLYWADTVTDLDLVKLTYANVKIGSLLVCRYMATEAVGYGNGTTLINTLYSFIYLKIAAGNSWITIAQHTQA